MESCVKTFPQWGRVLWMTDGKTEVGAALDFGIRVVHLSCAGMENLFYSQPADGSDGFATEGGWRLYGGHRFWLAPETDLSYAPDNAPVDYSLEENGVLLEQRPDPLLDVVKRLRITWEAGGAVCLEHTAENIADGPREWALWGVSTLDGGEADIPFPGSAPGDFTPRRVVALWADTDLHDPRLHFRRDGLTARHAPIEGYCKLGLGAAAGRATLRNKGQQLEIGFGTGPLEQYPDLGCNFELYMNKRFLELETLGPRCLLMPGQRAGHTELWRLKRL